MLGSEVMPPPLPGQRRSITGWTEEVEETLKGSSLKEEHHVLIGTTLQGVQSAEAGLHEVFKGIVTRFEVSTLATGSVSEEIEEINWKLEWSEKDLDLMNRKFEQSQAQGRA